MSLRDRIRLVFRSPKPSALDPDSPSPYQATPELEFVAYAEDCRLYGHLMLDAQRLTDMLNDHTEFELIDVAMEALVDGRIVELQSMIVARDELLVVQATGPRGARERRHRTRPHPVAVAVGPYLVRGHLHAMPSADPLVTMRRRPPMVPLTEGSVAFTASGQAQVRQAETVIINRNLMTWVGPATDEQVRFPEVPAHKGLLVKDFTGAIHQVIPDPEPVALPVAVVAPRAASSGDGAGSTESAATNAEPVVRKRARSTAGSRARLSKAG
jgi:hypothetical protein